MNNPINKYNTSNMQVSVVMATYNGEKYIADQIQSIIDQTEKNIELIIQDDASSDKTVEIIRSFEKSMKISLQINKKRIGFVSNFEKGIARATGRYIALSDQDDIWVENKIENLINEIGSADLIHSNCELIDDAGNILFSKWKKAALIRNAGSELLFENDITGCTILFKKELLSIILPFPLGLSYHDWWIAMCAASRKGIKYVDQALVKYRQHNNQEAGAGINRSSALVALTQKMRLFNRKAFIQVSEKQLANILSAKNILKEWYSEELVRDAIAYHKSLVSGLIHFHAFIIALRRSETVRPNDNLGFFKLFYRDLFG